jgi:DNA processing protein
MHSLDENALRRIALHLITFKNHKIKYRIEKFGIELSALYELDNRGLTSLGFLKEDIHDLKFRFKEIAETEINNCLKRDIDLVFREDEYYPQLLQEIFDPPDYLYVKGDKSVLKGENIAIVGSRKGNSYGRLALDSIIPDLCKAGMVVVSGMAFGIDAYSHQIAIREKGKTIGVNAGGLSHLYPAGHHSLMSGIITNGCIVSEFPLETVPRPFFFPIRNRIIAGISKAVLVVQAAMKSGSLITARLAIEQNRDVFAIPGRIDSPLSEGTNALITQGAKLIGGSRDIFDEYGIKYQLLKDCVKTDLSLKENKILDLMDENEVKDINYFVENLDWSVPEITSLLMGMVLKNAVTQINGGFRRVL